MAMPIPPDVVITRTAREPVWNPTLGIEVPAAAPGTPRHRLVTIGDSLTHGFQSGAIFNTHISYPAIIAHEMGWYEQFRYPTYEGFGGLPLNIENFIRELEQEFGDRIDWWEALPALLRARSYMDQVEDYWERGPGSQVPQATGIHHNLGVWGWDLRDTLSRNAEVEKAEIQPPRDNLLTQIVENANARSALRVLESARDAAGGALTPLEAAAHLGAEGTTESGGGDGIETLLVLLGANNVLQTVVKLEVIWSDDGFDDLNQKTRFTVWRPLHFQSELNQVVTRVRGIRARHVIWGTVPHVTIAPLARGVGDKIRLDSRYFPFYTRPWIRDGDFNPHEDKNFTADEARAVDCAIDQYNDAIAEAVRAARQDGKDWYLLDVAGLLDRLAFRRYLEKPEAQPRGWKRSYSPYVLPPELQALTPVPNSRFFLSGPTGRTQGGLFSLDGVHPTTIGYGILAQEFMNVMHLAGVKFYLPDGRTLRSGTPRVDFRRLIDLDTLISSPPRSLTSDLSLLGWADEKLDMIQRTLGIHFGGERAAGAAASGG